MIVNIFKNEQFLFEKIKYINYSISFELLALILTYTLTQLL